MSDRVQEIIEELILTAPLEDIPAEEDRASAAKQIRQQIGQELLERRHQLDEFVRLQDIHEVCQLEES